MRKVQVVKQLEPQQVKLRFKALKTICSVICLRMRSNPGLQDRFTLTKLLTVLERLKFNLTLVNQVLMFLILSQVSVVYKHNPGPSLMQTSILIAAQQPPRTILLTTSSESLKLIIRPLINNSNVYFHLHCLYCFINSK